MARPARRAAIPFEDFLSETWTVTSIPLSADVGATERLASSRPRHTSSPAPVSRLPSAAAGGSPPGPSVPPVPPPPVEVVAGATEPEVPAADAAAAVAGMGSRAARNTAVVLAARVASRLIALVTVIAVSRHLGADAFGRFQTLVTYTALTAVVVDLGFNTLYVREGARHPADLGRYLDNLLSVKLVLSIAGLIALALVLRIPDLGDLLVPGFALMVFSAYSNLLRGTFYATGRLGWEAADIVLEAAVQLAVSAVGFSLGKGPAFFVWAYAIGYGVSCVWFLTATIRLGIARPRWRFEPEILRPWLVTGMPLAVTYVLTNVYFKIDVPILQHNRPYQEVGWYTLAYRPFEALLFVPFTIRQVVFPVLSVYRTTLPARLQLSTETLYRALLLTGWPCSVGLFVLAPQITGLLRLYPESEPALRILALGIVVMFVDNTVSAVLNAVDRQALYAKVALSGLLVNIALDLLLIPGHGYLGAATATVLTEVQLAGTGWYVLARLGLRLDLARLSGRILAAGAGMGLVLLPFHNVRGIGTLLAIVVGAAVYCSLLALLRALSGEERALLQRAAARGRAGLG